MNKLDIRPFDMIGIIGGNRVGKDRLFAEFNTRFSNVKRFAQGDHLRKHVIDTVMRCLDVPEQYATKLVSDNKEKFRILYEGIGEGMREFLPEIWIQLVYDEIKSMHMAGIVPVITDIRNINTIHLILRKNNPLFIRLYRNDFPLRESERQTLNQVIGYLALEEYNRFTSVESLEDSSKTFDNVMERITKLIQDGKTK